MLTDAQAPKEEAGGGGGQGGRKKTQTAAFKCWPQSLHALLLVPQQLRGRGQPSALNEARVAPNEARHLKVLAWTTSHHGRVVLLKRATCLDPR